MRLSKRPKDYLSLINPFELVKTKTVLQVNPTIQSIRKDAEFTKIFVYDYNREKINIAELKTPEESFEYIDTRDVSWINIDGLQKQVVESICGHFQVHPLIAEDILSMNPRPKMDEIDGVLYCLLNMLFYNEYEKSVETEQISIVLGGNFVLSFQEDPSKDVFNPLREKLKIKATKVRQNGPDFLFYSLIDMIVDNYYVVMEKLGENIEMLEEDIIRRSDTRALARINMLRKEMIILKRSVGPVRELINGILRSESELIDEKTEKYFKDVYDHIIQANDLAESYRDMMINLQDLYLSNVNLKTNEVMKVMAIVTCLLAPATVIGGIFGMNFDRIPWLHNPRGFFITVSLMFIIPIYMIFLFRKKKWF
ncbi:MAG: magnesium/cobalt transporter CorA [Ginsengibacter sp.]